MNTISLFKSDITWARARDKVFFGIFLSNTLSVRVINNWKYKRKENVNGDKKAFMRQKVYCISFK